MKINFSSIFFCIGLSLISTLGMSQTDATRPSPPAEAKGSVAGAQLSIHYSSPSVKGRVIWGDLVPYGKVWRTGANEATVFETDKDIYIDGKKLPAGKCGMFTIPGETKWTFIFNSVWDQWGAYKYEESKDVIRVEATAKKSPVFNEQMRFEISENMVILSWENVSVSLDVKK